MSYSPMTKLEAVNQILLAIGEDSVNSIDANGDEFANKALKTLEEESANIQVRGYFFNTYDNQTLSKDLETGHFRLPSNTLRVDTMGKHLRVKTAQRGTRLFNLENASFDFPEYDSLNVQLIVFVEFEELPHAFANWITKRAGRVFANRVLGDQVIDGFTQRDENEAMALASMMDIEQGDYNVFEGNYDVQKALGNIEYWG